MKKKYKFLFWLQVFALSFIPYSVYASPDLTKTTHVEMTANTASEAKTVAMGQARREVFVDVLSRYSERNVIANLVGNIPDEELINFIGSVGIENERVSQTAYSADITMTLDRGSVEKWMIANNVPNYLAAADDSGDKSAIFFDIGGLSDWISMHKTLRDAGVWDKLDFDVKAIFGRQITASINSSAKSELVTAIKSAGWVVSENDGILRIHR